MLSYLSTPLKSLIENRSVTAPFPTETEVGLRVGNSGIHVRDDGVVEIHAGEASKIVLDPEGTVSVVGNSIVNVADSVRSKMSTEKYKIGDSSLNPRWLSGDDTSRRVLSPKNDPSIVSLEDLQVLTGTPSSGQYTVRLGDYLESQPLLLDLESPNPFKSIKDILGAIE
jgi:hypothetical protein